MNMDYSNKSDRELIVETYVMMKNVDKRTECVPVKCTQHDDDIDALKRCQEKLSNRGWDVVKLILAAISGAIAGFIASLAHK
jgi:hypothetical protein